MKLWQAFKASVNADGEDGEDEIKTAFRGYDVNGDGYITRDEMMQVKKEETIAIHVIGILTWLFKVITKMGFVANKSEEAAKCLAEMDLDGDGRVSYAEFMVKWKIT